MTEINSTRENAPENMNAINDFGHVLLIVKIGGLEYESLRERV
jgi:hypothetical protein